MKITREEFQAMLQRPAIKAVNPALGGLVATQREQDTRPALVKDSSPQQRRRGRLAVVVTLIAFRRRLLDDDNNTASFKHLRDSIARSLQIDDGSSDIRFQCGQLHTTAAEGSLVKIEWL